MISTTLKTYLQDFDFERLEVQLSDVNGTAFSGTTTSVMKVSSIRTISAAISNKSTIYKGTLQKVNIVVQLYLTFLVNSVSAEHSFLLSVKSRHI